MRTVTRTMIEEFLTRRQRGRIEGAQGVAFKLLQKRLGALPKALLKRLTALSPEQLEQLSLATLDFGSVKDLKAWLEAHSRETTTAH